MPRSNAPTTAKQCDQRIASLWHKVMAARRRGDTYYAEQHLKQIDHLLDLRAQLLEHQQRRRDWLGLDWSGRG